MEKCSKEKEIEKITKALWVGNGKKPLASLPDQVDNIGKSIEIIQSDIKVLLQFQTQVEVQTQTISETTIFDFN